MGDVATTQDGQAKVRPGQAKKGPAAVIDLRRAKEATAAQAARCVCNLEFASGDLVLEHFDEGKGEIVTIHAFCWDDLDGAETFWDEGPASIGVIVKPGATMPKASEFAYLSLRRALEYRDAGEAKKFSRELAAALESAEEVFFDLHEKEINEGKYYPDDDPREVEIAECVMEKVKADATSAGPAEIAKSRVPVDCHLCGRRLASGDVAVAHGSRRAPDAGDALSHAHCAVLRVNSSRNWTGLTDGKPMARSWVWQTYSGIRSFVALDVPMSPSEVAWRAKRHKKALERARGAIASCLLSLNVPRGEELARMLRRDSAILRGRDENAKARRSGGA